jgi:hypothetical protein
MAHSPVQGKRYKSINMDAPAQLHQSRTGILDREVPFFCGTRSFTFLVDEGGFCSNNLRLVDRVPAWQGLGGICLCSTHPLCAFPLMPTDWGQLDEGICFSVNPDLSLSVDLPELHPAQQTTGVPLPPGTLRGPVGGTQAA